jgi:ribosomal protein L11 methyltransferase
MKSQRRDIIIYAASLVAITIIASPASHVNAFQASVPSSTSLSHLSSQYHYPRCQFQLNTASKESTELTNNDDSNLQDVDDNEADSWVLRQITFLGLSAPSKNESEDNDVDDNLDEDGTSKNALDARNLSEFLMEIGACSVSITDSDADTDEENPLFDEPTSVICSNDALDDEELGEEWAMVIPDLAAGRNLWKRCDVSAHFPSSLDVPSIVDAVRYTFHCPTSPRYKVDDVPDLDWIQHVQESWNPIVTRESKFVLRFPWHEDGKVMQACQEMEREKMQEAMQRQFSSGVKREGAVVHFDGDGAEANNGEKEIRKSDRDYVQIQLEGGIAFGTGEHPTTRLCLDWVRDKVEAKLSENGEEDSDEALHFLDYGAGSGVLGIAAASVVRDYNDQSKRSRQHQIPHNHKAVTTVGVEIDADAIHIANDNAKKNNVEMANYLPDANSLDAEALSVVMRAMQRKRNKGLIQTLPEELNGPIYDLCAANILASPLVNLAPTIASLVKSPGGEIGLSGVLATQAESVVEAYQEFFEDVKVAGEDGGWVLITGKRR